MDRDEESAARPFADDFSRTSLLDQEAVSLYVKLLHNLKLRGGRRQVDGVTSLLVRGLTVRQLMHGRYVMEFLSLNE